MEASPSLLAAGDRATIRAALTDVYGNPAEGDTIEWQASGGKVEPQECRLARGIAEARFTAGPSPGSAWVRLGSGGPSSRVAISISGPLDRSSLIESIALPAVWRHAVQAGGCRNVALNGSFEEVSADGRLQEWEVTGKEGVHRREGDAPQGRHFLSFSGDGDNPRAISQETWVPSASEGAELRLWVRGGGPGAVLRVSVWTTLDFGRGPVRTPVLAERLPIDDPDWTLLAVELPTRPTGTTSLQLSPRDEAEGRYTIDIDEVRLELCEPLPGQGAR